MPYSFYNPNPDHNFTIDCVIRAVSKLMNTDWDTAYVGITFQGFVDKSMPSDDNVWGEFLRKNGYSKHVIPEHYPENYTVRHFAEDHPRGKYLLKASGHVVAVCDGDYYDSWDSGNEIPIYYWERSEDNDRANGW